MATEKQKTAAKRNVKKAVAVSASRRTRNLSSKRSRHPLSSSVKSDLKSTEFAFPRQRKEPLTYAKHVRNAIARFDQVEGVSDRERDAAWRRIKAAAKKHDIEVSAASWRQLT
jgi:hypothetical protein